MSTFFHIPPSPSLRGLFRTAKNDSPPLAPPTPEVQQIIDFVEGRLDAHLFKASLCENTRFEDVLNKDPMLLADTFGGQNVYLYVIGENLRSPRGMLNVHGILAKFLQRSGFTVKPTRLYEEIHDLILSAQPKWLDVDPEYVQREILAHAAGRTGAALRRWLRDEILMRFRCAEKPPHWLQSPRWPIGANGPLVFLGQLPVRHHFQREAAAYVFHDTASGASETIIQVC